MHFLKGDRVYIDESKARGYYVAATASAMHDAPGVAKEMRALLLPGQRRLHFKSERDSRRRQILARICELEVRVSVWCVQGASDKVARPECLMGVVKEMVRSGASQLIVERDASLERADRKVIAGALKDLGGDFDYRHAAPHEEPLLWISDAVAWCYTKQGDWISRCHPIVAERVVRL